jgi:hypothetical protein
VVGVVPTNHNSRISSNGIAAAGRRSCRFRCGAPADMASSRYFAYHVDLQGVALASYELQATEDTHAVSGQRLTSIRALPVMLLTQFLD